MDSASTGGDISSSAKWNFKNPAVKRIIRELKEIQGDSNPDIVAEALEVCLNS